MSQPYSNFQDISYISRIINSSISLKRTLQIVSKEAARILDVSLVVIFLKVKGKDEAKLLGEYSKKKRKKSQLGEIHILDKSHPITTRILKKGKTFISNNTEKLIPKLPESAQNSLRQSHVKAFIGLPLRYQNKTVGAIIFDDTKGIRTFTREEVVLAQIIAEQSAVAIAEAQHVEDLRLLKKQLQRLSSELIGKQILDESKRKPRKSHSVYIPPQYSDVAIVMVDLKGATVFASKNEVYKIACMYEDFYQIAQNNFQSFDGFYSEMKGNEVILYFYSPFQALKAAKHINKKLKLFSKTYGMYAGISVHYGSVLIGFLKTKTRKFHMIIGKIIQSVKQLQTFSQKNEVVISEEVVQNLLPQQKRVFSFSKKRKRKVRGKEVYHSVYFLLK